MCRHRKILSDQRFVLLLPPAIDLTFCGHGILNPVELSIEHRGYSRRRAAQPSKPPAWFSAMRLSKPLRVLPIK
jgi:hypothetical protein